MATARPSFMLKSDYYFTENVRLFVNRNLETFDLAYHAHDFVELAYVAEGFGFHHIGDAAERVGKGRLYVIPVGVSHVFRPASANQEEPLVVYNCVIAPDLLASLREMAEPILRTQFDFLMEERSEWFSVPDHDGTIERLLYGLHREFVFRRSGSTTMMYAMLLQLLVSVFRARQECPELPAAAAPNALYDVLAWLDEHYGEPLDIASLAGRCGFSKRHFQRLFKQYTGQTFARYMQSLRIRKSCDMLRETGDKIQAVAERAGYRDIDSFNRVFRRIVGMTPGAYRQQMQEPSPSDPAVRSQIPAGGGA
ncbi:AraC family transcriptional regulator [Paenibacillus sp. 32O-W]|uniref:AraC family transcriptional regulator n=1 Tax=Paenibacillus sp. 32O-W TaxID=1695218 RepID=UPI00071ECA80|nr:AraC family transcriptional regulator [Paenibacillus sp. 32O-W]ALS26643.1 AraC family transcriptional regulator [Paenibacillus sp. 32O-W]